MTSEEFMEFEKDLISKGKIRAGYGKVKDLCQLMGVNKDTVTKYQSAGTPGKLIDLALTSLVLGNGPYPDIG